VVAAIIECVDRDGAVLLARNHAWPERMFALVTGFLEKGESPEEAVAREVKEEVNLDAVRLSCSACLSLFAQERAAASAITCRRGARSC
jgi:NADH pyrophosphatase NudC (nudix superfamily)